MTMKPFEIQSTALSLNGVVIDTSVTGKLLIPGITRATASVAIEVNDTQDQSYSWSGTPVVIDGYTYAVYITGEASGLIGWSAAEYAIDGLDGEGYIDGINIVSGGANYTGEAVTYSKVMYAANEGTQINNSTNGQWIEIPFSVRCGADDIESEFGSGGNTGDITFDGTVISTAPGDTILIQTTSEQNDDNEVSINTSNVDIYAYNSDSESWAELYLDNNDNTDPQAKISVQAAGGAQQDWMFQSNGNLTLPSNGDIIRDGVSVLGGGSADTGNISFTTTALQSPTDSNVGWPNGIISLMPGAATDSGYVDRGQYLNIYPTNAEDAPHIHIAAGMNTETSQLGDLILGNDSQHIDINGGGNILIKTNNQSYEWTFGMDGKLVIPSGGDITRDGSSVLGGSGVTSLSALDDVGIDGVADGQILMWVDADSRWENMNLPSGGTVNQLTNGSYTVTLQSDGSIVIPQGDSSQTNRGQIFSDNESSFINLDTQFNTDNPGGIRIGTGAQKPVDIITYAGDEEGARSWRFDWTGEFVVPGHIKNASTQNYINLDNSGNISLVSFYNGVAIVANDDGPSKTWLFGTDGNLVLPDGGTINDATGNSVLVKDHLQNGQYSFTLDSEGTITAQGFVNLNYQGDQMLSIGTGPSGASIIANTGKSLVLGTDGYSKSWIFNTDGSIQFPDNTVQRTAYDYVPQNLVNLDGGIASTQYPTNYVYVDCGGSYLRGILSEDTFDGEDNGATQSSFEKVLNGGGA